MTLKLANNSEKSQSDKASNNILRVDCKRERKFKHTSCHVFYQEKIMVPLISLDSIDHWNFTLKYS